MRFSSRVKAEILSGKYASPCRLSEFAGAGAALQDRAYTKECVISSDANIGRIRGTTTLTRGTWYAVLVARSSKGESAVSQEFELYSAKPRKSTVFYLK